MHSNIRTDESASVSVIFALSLVVLFGAAGIAIDYSRTVAARQALQITADSAALAGANPQLSSDLRIAAATNYFEANGNFPAPVVSAMDATITVTAYVDVPTLLLRVLGKTAMRIEVTATAAMGVQGPDGRACLIALNAADDHGIRMGSASNIQANCGIYVNNATDTAITAGSGAIKTLYTASVGGWEEPSNFLYSPLPQRVSAAMRDLLAGLEAPTVGPCTAQDLEISGNAGTSLSPGVYCGGLAITSRDPVTFAPGTYVIRDGKFSIASQAQVKGDGVFFFLQGAEASIDWGSDAHIEFRAMKSGPHQGMLIWSEGLKNSPNVIGSHVESVLEGTVYSPLTAMVIACNADVGARADWTVWLVRSLEVGSNAKLTINDNHQNSATPLPQLLENAALVTAIPAHLIN